MFRNIIFNAHDDLCYPNKYRFAFFLETYSWVLEFMACSIAANYIYKSDQCVYVLAFKWRFVGGGGRCSLCVVHLLHVTMVVVFIGDG